MTGTHIHYHYWSRSTAVGHDIRALTSNQVAAVTTISTCIIMHGIFLLSACKLIWWWSWSQSTVCTMPLAYTHAINWQVHICYILERDQVLHMEIRVSIQFFRLSISLMSKFMMCIAACDNIQPMRACASPASGLKACLRVQAGHCGICICTQGQRLPNHECKAARVCCHLHTYVAA